MYVVMHVNEHNYRNQDYVQTPNDCFTVIKAFNCRKIRPKSMPAPNFLPTPQIFSG